MQKNLKTFHFALLFILASLILAGCTQSTPTPDPDTFYPECNEHDLIKAINDANLTPSIPAEIELPNYCLYTLKEVDNTVLWQGLNIHSGFPAIISEITIYRYLIFRTRLFFTVINIQSSRCFFKYRFKFCG